MRTSSEVRANPTVQALLRELGDPPERELVHLLRKAVGRDSRYAWLAGVMCFSELVPELTKQLFSTDDQLVSVCATSLGQIGSKRATRQLLRCLSTESQPQIQKVLINSLGLIADRRAISALCRILDRRANDASVRAEAAEALSAFVRDADTICPFLISAMREPTPIVQFFAIFSIGTLRCKSALPLLQPLVFNTSIETPYGKLQDEVNWAISRITNI